MVDDASGEYAVPQYRDPEKTARIVEARRRGKSLNDIAAREGVSRQRVWAICRDAGLTPRSRTTPPPHPCATCGKLLRVLSAVYCSRKCAAARHPDGREFYERRRDTGLTWREIAAAAPGGARPRHEAVRRAARRYAEDHGLPWPLPSERIARRDDKGEAEVRAIVEHEKRILALRDALPKDRAITKGEAERFLVDLYKTGMRFGHIAERTNCSRDYVVSVVRRLAPEAIRARAPRGEKAPHGGPLLDLRELRLTWRGFPPRR